MSEKLSDAAVIMLYRHASREPRDKGISLEEYPHWADDLATRLEKSLAREKALVEALKAQGKLISWAQDKLSAFLQPDGDVDQLANELLELFDGPKQREILKATNEALESHKAAGGAV